MKLFALFFPILFGPFCQVIANDFAFNRCIRFDADITLHITYKTMNGGSNSVEMNLSNQELNVDKNMSSCNVTEQHTGLMAQKLTLHFTHNKSTIGNLDFEFTQPNTEIGFNLSSVSVNMTLGSPLKAKDIHFTAHNNVDTSIKASKNKTLTCQANMIYPVTNNFKLELARVKAQAFVDQKGWLPEEEVCEEDKTTTSAVTTSTAPPVVEKWRVGSDNHTCILLYANVTIALQYPMMNKSSEFVDIEVPHVEADSSSSCNSIDPITKVKVQKLVIKFSPKGSESAIKKWQVVFWFTDNKTLAADKAFSLYQINVTAFFDDPLLFPNASEKWKNYSGHFARPIAGAKEERSLKCSEGEFQLGDTAKLILKPYQLQAFAQSQQFLKEELCEKDVHTSDVVPIVVGACLAALVIVVLVAYLIGRARAKRQGYASV